MLKKYDELTEAQKESARRLRPDDYRDWLYRTAGVNIQFAGR